jgi:hypothetical protein
MTCLRRLVATIFVLVLAGSAGTAWTATASYAASAPTGHTTTLAAPGNAAPAPAMATGYT